MCPYNSGIWLRTEVSCHLWCCWEVTFFFLARLFSDDLRVICVATIFVDHILFSVSPAAGTYILPGGLATSRAIAPFEAEAIESHPYIRDAFGDKYQWEVSTSYALYPGSTPVSLDSARPMVCGRQSILCTVLSVHTLPSQCFLRM